MSARKELYRFSHGSRVWCFTSSSRPVVFNGVTYKPVPGLERTNIEDESIDKCDTDVIFPYPHPLLNNDGESLSAVYDRKIYYGSVQLTILELHKGESLVLFKGRVTQPKFDHHEHTMTLVCKTGESHFERNLITPVFQSPCAHKLYDRLCGLKFEDWAFEATVTAINGLDVQFTVNPTQVVDENGEPVYEQIPVLDEFGQPVLDGEGQPVYENGDPVMETKTYSVGYLTDGLMRQDGIWTSLLQHSSGQVRLYMQHVGLKVGDVIMLAPGCDQTLTTCHDFFSNNLRHGGFPNIPQENPVNNQLMK